MGSTCLWGMLMSSANLPRSRVYELGFQGFLQVPQGLELSPLEAQFPCLACCLGWSPDCECAHQGTSRLTAGFSTIRVIPTVPHPFKDHPGLLEPSLGEVLIFLPLLAPSPCKPRLAWPCLYSLTLLPSAPLLPSAGNCGE